MATWWQKLTKNPFLTSSVMFTITYGFNHLLNFVTNFVIVKTIPVDWYGEYASSVAYVNLLAIPLSILTLIIVKKAGEINEQDRPSYFRRLEKRLRLTAKKYWWLVVLGLMILGFALGLKANLTTAMSLIFILLSMPLSLMVAFYGGCLQGMKNFRVFGLSNLAGGVIKTVGAILVVWWKPSLLGIYMAVLLGQLTTALIQRIVVIPSQRKIGSGAKENRAISKKVIAFDLKRLLRNRAVWLPTLTTIGVMAMVNSDLVMVKAMLSPTTAGFYGVISLLAKTVNYAFTPITQVAFAFGAGKETVKHREKNLKMTTGIMLTVGVIVILAFALLPNLIIMLFAKDEYLELAPMLWLVAIFGVFYSLNNLYAQYFLVKNRSLALVSLVFAIGQIIGIAFWHDSLEQIMTVNLLMSGLLCLVYMIVFWADQNNARVKLEKKVN